MNPQERLRLEHIAPYLPYGLKIYFEPTINDTDFWVLYPMAIDACLENQNKPILRPLSDITKDDNIDLYESLSYNSKMFVLRTDLKQHDWVKAIRYDDFTNLLKNHFDMFNLIEKGLAIDFNQLKLTDN